MAEELIGVGASDGFAVGSAHIRLGDEVEFARTRILEGSFDEELARFKAAAEAVAERLRSLESPESAVLAVGEESAGTLAALEDEYLAARANKRADR